MRALEKPMNRNGRRWPAWGWLGLILVAVCWPLNWMLPGVRTAYLFFPLWLGYILTVEALVQTRSGNSLWSRSPKNFVLLFVISAPVWWLFELINLRTANWEYLGGELFSPLEFNLLSTLSFSTVIPAVFETAELLHSFSWMRRFASAPRVQATPATFVSLFVAGLVFLHIFEMPILGYGGYVPFALELYALKNLMWPSGPRLGQDD